MALRTTSAIPNPLCFHMNFWIDFPISVKNDIEILMDITLNLQIAFGSSHFHGINSANP
jgi:hypothetical protein